MTKSKHTQRALLMSVLSMMLCLAMLAGTTFAWFTDTVTSGRNKIASGTLKVDLAHVVADEDGKPTEVSIKDHPDHLIFDYDNWEPGYTAMETLKVKNVGSLALKYEMYVMINGSDTFKTEEGKTTTLADVIDVYLYKGELETKPTSFAEIKDNGDWEARGTLAEFITSVNEESGNPTPMMSGKLLSKGKTVKVEGEEIESVQMTIALHMQELASNEYQGRNLGDVSIFLRAAQYTYEDDSFNDKYDDGANWPKFPDITGGDEDWYDENKERLDITNQNQLVEFANLVNDGTDSFEDKTIMLTEDISLNSTSNWVPIGTSEHPFKGTFDGDGHTVSGMMIDSEVDTDAVSFIGVAEGAKIQNLTVAGNITVNRKVANTTTVSGGTYFAGICAYAKDSTMIEKCVNKVDINIDAFVGDQLVVGGILGSAANGSKSSVTNCLNCGHIGYDSEYSFENAIWIGGIIGEDYKSLSQLKNVVNVGSIQEDNAADGGNIYATGICPMVESLSPEGNNWFSTTCDMLTYFDSANEEGTSNTYPQNETDFSSLLGEDSAWIWNPSLGYPVLK